MQSKSDFLTHVPPMGIYETLYRFLNSFGTYMGEKGTHPWSQGYPLTSQVPGGPKMPKCINSLTTFTKPTLITIHILNAEFFWKQKSK